MTCQYEFGEFLEVGYILVYPFVWLLFVTVFAHFIRNVGSKFQNAL